MPTVNNKQVVIDRVREDRKDLAKVLKKHTGIRRIVEDLYPDSAHFIYELLQNAEDTGATEVEFQLTDDRLSFEHNGRPFSEEDIFGITDVGEGTKFNDVDTIGNFGVGFKAVFAYTEAPRIWSPTYSFEINELVLPSLLKDRTDLNGKTRFEFPFNNPKKPQDEAFNEVARGLRELAETTLLFLSNINAINWNINDCEHGAILRVEHSDVHVEVLKETDGAKTASSHFLRFTAPVEGLEVQRLAVAFALEPLPDSKGYLEGKPISGQFKIAQVPGQVAVFFPAEKETSGLRFHVHAPFVPELSRASIKNTPANDPLYAQLAILSVAAMHGIRDLGLLSSDFLAVLPNPLDSLGKRYEQIRSAIISAFREEPLMPTHAKGHAPSKYLYQAKASLKELLKPDDLEYVIDYEDEPPQWAANRALQGTNIERFMNGLEIEDWDISDFAAFVVIKGGNSWRRPDPAFLEWLAQKPVVWFQQFYALLAREPEAEGYFSQLKDAHIVRLSDAKLGTGSKSFFPDEHRRYTNIVPCVEPETYLSGKSKAQQSQARQFLEKVGVTEIGERELVLAILDHEYVSDDRPFNKRDYVAHIRRLIKLLDSDPSAAEMMGKYRIFFGQDGKWHPANEIYIDLPYKETGLNEFFQIVGSPDECTGLADLYDNLPIDPPKIVSLALSLGAISLIEVSQTRCQNNPRWNHLRLAPGQRWTSPINEDYFIERFDDLVAAKSVRIARLIWNSLNDYEPHPSWLQARYQKNYSGGPHYADSQAVFQLRTSAWVPQDGGQFVKPAHARAELLPKGFVFDPGSAWIRKVEFGKAIELQTAQAQAEAAAASAKKNRRLTAAAELGFQSPDDLAWLEKLSEIPVEEREQLLAEWNQRRAGVELPDHEPRNPDRRSEKVGAIAAGAPERLTDKRLRTVSVGREDVKGEAKQYLYQQYTKDGEMICQVCKRPMPFRLTDGTPYFESVEFLRELTKRHHQNYLALCPNHAAMFQYANGTDGMMLDLFLEVEGNELDVILAQTDNTIYFTKTHIADLKAVIETDRKGLQDVSASENGA